MEITGARIALFLDVEKKCKCALSIISKPFIKLHPRVSISSARFTSARIVVNSKTAIIHNRRVRADDRFGKSAIITSFSSFFLPAIETRFVSKKDRYISFYTLPENLSNGRVFFGCLPDFALESVRPSYTIVAPLSSYHSSRRSQCFSNVLLSSTMS